MASLTGNLVAETYKALLKTIDNDILTASEKQITDGLGGGSNVFIDSQGFLRANKYKVTNGLATQFLKADGSLDANAYLTSITGAQVITALGFTPVTNQRTLTINGVTYNLTADRSWTVEGTAAVWGNITGTLSNQTDLQNALNAKYNVPAGTISQYIRGDGTLATFPTLPGGLPIGGTSGQILAKIDATDYNTHWIDNFATQTKNEVKLGQTLAKGAAVYVSSANGTNMIVSAASNTSEALSSKTFGLLETGGVTNDLVKCVTFGLLAGLDTSTAQAGDPVWLGVNGALIFGLANKPYAPKHLVYIGVVTRVQSNNGEIFVNIQNGFELKEIHDVYIADPANNHGLFYDIADGLWKNKSIATALGYTPQAQLDGTGFVKASGTTITYDNSTYLTTTDAASTYQRLDNIASSLFASATNYPNNNAVIAGLALKADAANPVFTGSMNIVGLESRINFYDENNLRKYFIGYDSGTLRIFQDTGSESRFYITPTGQTFIPGTLTVGSVVKDGGTASQFLKADGSIDSNTYVQSSALADYLLISTAASTYQRLDRMSINLLASDINYPNNNAVINALALKANAANPVFTGNMTISGAEPKLFFTDTDNNPDYTVFIDSGIFYIYDQTAGTTRFSISSTGNISAGVGKSITADSFIKDGGTASQFLKADGTIDSNTYVASSALANYLLISTAASTYQRLDNMAINLLASDTQYPNNNAVIAALALKANAANPVFTGNMSISGAEPKLFFVDTDNNPDYTVFIDSGFFYIYDQTAGATRFSINSSGNINTGVGKSITAGSFIKESGTSSQYLMADGSVSTFAGVTGSGTTNYLPKWTSASAIGNSVIFDNGNIGIRTTSTYSPLTVQGYGIAWGENSTFYASSSGYTTLAFWLQGATDYTGTWVISKQSRTVEASVEYFQIAKNGLTGSALHRADALQSWDVNGNSYFGYKVGIGTMTPSASKLSLGMGVGVKFLIYDNPAGVFSGLGQDMAAGDSTDLFAHGSGGLGFLTFGQLATNKTTYTEWARFRTNGWFGIGTTSPDARLHVQSPTVAYGQIRFLNSSADGEATIHIGRSGQTAEQRWTFGQGPAGIGDNFGFYTLGSNKFTLSTSGAGTFLGRLQALNFFSVGSLNSTDGSFFIDHPGIQTWKIGVSSTNTSMFSIGNDNGGSFATKVLNIANSGNVLIGTTTDLGSNKLQVEGNIKFGTWTTPASRYIGYTRNDSGVFGVDGSSGMEIESVAVGGNYSQNVHIWSHFYNGGSGRRMTFLYNGNVGIGIVSPSSKLSIYESTGSTTSTLDFNTTGNSIKGHIGMFANNFYITSNWFYNGSQNADNLAYAQNAISFDNTGFMAFQVGAAGSTVPGEKMRINANGNIGIGNSGLSALGKTLTVEGTIISQTGAGGGNYNENMRANRAGNGYAAIAMGGAYGSTAGTGTGQWTLVATPAGVNYNFEFDYAGATKVAFSTGGNITATAFFESSDIRLKTIIESNPIINGIEKLEAKLYEKNGKIELGYFAQDAELIMPYAVTKNHDGFLNLSYREIHTAKIARLEKEVAQLKAQLNLN